MNEIYDYPQKYFLPCAAAVAAVSSSDENNQRMKKIFEMLKCLFLNKILGYYQQQQKKNKKMPCRARILKVLINIKHKHILPVLMVMTDR